MARKCRTSINVSTFWPHFVVLATVIQRTSINVSTFWPHFVVLATVIQKNYFLFKISAHQGTGKLDVSLPIRRRKKVGSPWRIWYFLPHIPALSVMSLIQTARHTMADVRPDFRNFLFHYKEPEIEFLKKCRVSVLYFQLLSTGPAMLLWCCCCCVA